MVNEKMLLVYGLANKDINVLKTFNKAYRVVSEDIIGTKVEDLIKGENFKPSENKIPREKIILVNGYNDREVDALFKIVRGAMGKNVIVAVVTENSNGWSFDYLALEHLIKERDWYKKNKK